MRKFISLFFMLIFFGTAHSGEPDFTKIKSYQCNGTEPFWNLNITPDSITYSDPQTSNNKIAMNLVKADNAAGLRQGYLQVFRTKTKDKGEAATVIVKYTGNCSEGMSDLVYAYDSILIFQDRILSGCCVGK